MRDEEDVQAVCAALDRATKALPDQRVGQILVNAIHVYGLNRLKLSGGAATDFDGFYLQDRELAWAIDDYVIYVRR